MTVTGLFPLAHQQCHKFNNEQIVKPNSGDYFKRGNCLPKESKGGRWLKNKSGLMLHYYSKVNIEVNISVCLFCVVTKGRLALSCQLDGVLTPRCWLAARLLPMGSTRPALGPAHGSARRPHGGSQPPDTPGFASLHVQTQF